MPHCAPPWVRGMETDPGAKADLVASEPSEVIELAGVSKTYQLGDVAVPALRNVDLNPVRARLVVEAVSYEWSSAASHVSGKDLTGLLDQEAWREVCPLKDWGEVLAAVTPDEQLAERLRQATRTGPR